MTAITTDTFLDSAARTAGNTFEIGAGAKFTIRTDSRLHANAPASMTGSLGNPTFTDIGGEFIIDATAVRWLAFNSASGNVPAIGATISQGGVSGYFLGCWSLIGAAGPTASGTPINGTTGFIKLREVTGGTFSAGALTGITASATGPDVPGWVEVVFDAATNFVVPRVGKWKSRGNWFELGTTNGSVGQQLYTPTSSNAQTNNFPPGVWVETASGSGEYEFWPGLASAANGWSRLHLGYPAGGTDTRGKFVKSFGAGIIQFGESNSYTGGTYSSLAAQAGTYAGITISGTYSWANNVVWVNTAATAHLLETGMVVGLDFTSGSGVDNTFTITVIDAFNFTATYSGSGTGGNVTIRPGVTITFTAHTLNIGEQVYCDFTSGTGVDGTYTVYSVGSANAYNISYPHTAALTSGNVSCLHTLVVTYTSHGLALGNEVYLDFTAGNGVDGRYVIKTVATNTFNVNFAHSAVNTTQALNVNTTTGHVPPTGCRVRIPNIIIAECATASRAANSVPNATIASRPEFATTTAGAIDIEYLYALSLRSIFAQAYSVRLINSAFSETLDVSECASALDINNVGVGMYSAVDARAAVFTSCFAGGTIANLYAHRGNVPGTTDHSAEFLYCRGQTITNLSTGIVQFPRSTGIALNISTCQNLTFNGVKVFNGNIPIAASTDLTLKNIDYNDRYIGKTNATTPYTAIVVSGGCDNIKIDGFSLGMNNTIADCHPYTGLLSFTASTNLISRNFGTYASPLNIGNWAVNLNGCGTPITLGGNNDQLKFQRIFLGKPRAGIITVVNSDKNILLEHFYLNTPYIYGTKAAYTTTILSLNTNGKAITTGTLLASGQTSVYGTGMLDFFQGTSYGAILIHMNEPSAETASLFTIHSGSVKFNSSGGVAMRTAGDSATWEMGYFAQGHTGFFKALPSGVIEEVTMSGGTIANYTITYSIDKASGYSAFHNLYYERANGSGSGAAYTFTVTDATGVEVDDYVFGTNIGIGAKVTQINSNTITVDVANIGTVSGVIRFNHLPAETGINSALGFKLKVKITTVTNNSTDITFLKIPTSSTNSAQSAISYPLDLVPISVNAKTTTGSNIVGAQVLLRTDTGGDLPYEESVTISNSGTTATVTHSDHGMETGDKVLIKGASLWQNNGVFTITKTGTSSYTYTMGSSPGSSPTGTIVSSFVFLNGTTDSNGLISTTKYLTNNQPVKGWARKSSGAPYYKTGILFGTANAVTGVALSTLLVADE